MPPFPSYFLGHDFKDNVIIRCYCKLLKTLELSFPTLWDVSSLARRFSYNTTLRIVFFTACLLTVRWHYLFADLSDIPNVRLDIIAKIESSNNPNVIGDDGHSFGLYQVSKTVLNAYNARFKASYSPSELLSPKINEKVASWYFNEELPRLIKHFKKSKTVSTRDLLIAYNAGISYIAHPKKNLPKVTINYIKKYQKLGGKL